MTSQTWISPHSLRLEQRDDDIIKPPYLRIKKREDGDPPASQGQNATNQ